MKAGRLTFRPLTPDRWGDFVALFGQRGACGGCWCMFDRRPRAEWLAQKGAGNRRAMKRLVDGGTIPGILAYAGTEPIGWCAVAPRSEILSLARSRTLKPIDDRPVWSVTCFFVARGHRRRGLSTSLLEAAAAYVKRRGGRILEGYPVVPSTGTLPDAFAWTGLDTAYRRAGFEEVARPSRTRAIMRKTLMRNDG